MPAPDRIRSAFAVSPRRGALELARQAGRFGKPRVILSGFVALTSLAIVGQTWWAVEQDRRLTIASEGENGRVAVRLLEEHATQQLEAASLRLDSVANATAALRQAAPVEDAQVREIVADTLKNSRSAGAYQFVNLAGRRWAHLLDFPAYVFAAEQRDYIPFLLGHPAKREVVFGHPLQRFIDGELVLPIARNLYDGHGRHLGLVSTEVSVAYFNAVYERVAQNSKAVVQLSADAGFVIVRSPFDVRTVKLDLSGSALQAALRAGPAEGSFSQFSLLDDGKQRLLTYRRVKAFPATIVFGREFDSVLANWSVRTRDRILFSGLFILLNVLLTYYLLLHMRRLQQSDTMLRASETKFNDLFQCAPVPLALIRLDTDELIEANDAILEQFGYAREEFVGATPDALRLWVDTQARQPYLNQLLANGAVERYEVRLRRKDGSDCTCLLSTRLIATRGVRVGIFSPIDVSRQRQVEHEIRELNAELEQRVLQRTLTLEEALETVKNMQGEIVRSEKMAALGSLVAGVAHELNTPIGNSVLIGSSMHDHVLALGGELATERPRRSVLNEATESLRTASDILLRNLQRAVALITSFKQVAVDQSSDQCRSFDLRTSVEELALALGPMYKKHVLKVDVEDGLAMTSYPGALAQVLTNLVSNAVNHAFEGRDHGRMTIEGRAFGDDRVELVFSDDGNGIPEEHLGHVFEPFFTTKLGHGGSGLGMNIVYNLVTGVLGGKIALISRGGTTITMMLPRKPARAVPTQQATQPAPEA